MDRTGAAGTGTVVVGLDGSPGSRLAFEYALADATRRAARLRVVVAVRMPEMWVAPAVLDASMAPAEMLSAARVQAERTVDEIVATRPGGVVGVPITVDALAGAPAAVLVDAAADADLLVLGHRGRGPLASALLGSVGMHVLLHATCPVTVVPPRPARKAAEARKAPAVLAQVAHAE